jgi:hypothetical protein
MDNGWDAGGIDGELVVFQNGERYELDARITSFHERMRAGEMSVLGSPTESRRLGKEVGGGMREKD